MKLMDLEAAGVITDTINASYVDVVVPTIKFVSDVPNQFEKANASDAGFDIRALHKGFVVSHSSALIETGLYVAIPEGYVGIIKSRSGLSVKSGIDVGAGVIDASYRGEVKVLLRNNKDRYFDYSEGDKIAQMIVVPICLFAVKQVESLDETVRGNDGFGSTGVR